MEEMGFFPIIIRQQTKEIRYGNLICIRFGVNSEFK